MTDEAASRTDAAARLLSAETLYGIRPLELRARVIAEGVLAGAHRSKRFGSSADFAEHKVYTPGDDLRHLDWKVLGKIDRNYVKRFEDETQLEVALVVDRSASMAYAGGARGRFGISKLDAARTLAAALAYIGLARGDSTGVSLFAGEDVLEVPARAPRGHLTQIAEHLERATAQGPTDVLRALDHVAARMRRRGFVVLLSDLVDAGSAALGPLGVLRRRGCDCLVLHTLDRDELELPFDGVIRFEDLEGDRVVQVDAPLVRDSYLAELRAFLDEMRATCERQDVRYVLAPTDASPVLTLSEALEGGSPLLRAEAA